MAALLRYTVSTCQKCTLLNSLSQNVTASARHNSNRASIAHINRKIYQRMFPTTIVQPDGSTYTIRYNEPRKIIKLPLDITTLSPEEKKIRLQKRKPRVKMEVKEEIEDNFRADKYSYLWKNKK